MKIELSKPFARDGKVEEDDVRRIKRALNRLGYYQPFSKTGISGVPDAQVFDALKSFQRDQGLKPTGAAKPGDETITALSNAASKLPEGNYIWRTVGDTRVREEHVMLEGTERSWREFPVPGEEEGCRCWAIPVAAKKCAAEKEKVAEAQKTVKDLSDKFNDLMLHLQELIDEGKGLVFNAQKSLGGQAVSYILTLPFDRLGILTDLLREYFANIISEEFLKAANSFMKEFWAVKQKAQYVKDQRDITLAQLEKAAKNLEEAKKKLEECEKSTK